MNEAKFSLTLLTTLSILALKLSSCKTDYPLTPTKISGIVFDEKNIPMKNVTVLMYGLKFSGLSGIPTFEIQTLTDSLGFYSLFQLIPNETKNVQMDAYYDDHVNPPTSYLLYVPIDSLFVRKNGPYDIPSSSFGKSNTVNFQFRKAK